MKSINELSSKKLATELREVLALLNRLNKQLDQGSNPFKTMPHWEIRDFLVKYGYKIQKKI